jgi:hypothetical protein
MKDIFIKLKILAKMESQKDIKEFESIIWELGAQNDREIIKNLISLFNDNCKYPEIMYSLVHAIEQCDTTLYTTTVVQKIEEGVIKYPMWIEILFNRIFNDNISFEIFHNMLHSVPKGALLKLFDIMEKESGHHAELIKGLRKELQLVASKWGKI